MGHTPAIPEPPEPDGDEAEAVAEAANSVRGHTSEELIEVTIGHIFKEQTHRLPNGTHTCG